MVSYVGNADIEQVKPFQTPYTTLVSPSDGGESTGIPSQPRPFGISSNPQQIPTLAFHFSSGQSGGLDGTGLDGNEVDDEGVDGNGGVIPDFDLCRAGMQWKL